MKKIIFSLLVSVLLFSCNYTPKPPLGSVENVVVNRGGESIKLTWDKVDGATEYRVFYTYDGTNPSINSQLYKTTSTNSIEITELETSKTYTFLVEALANDYAPAMSKITDGYQPNPIITVEADFSGVSTTKKVIIRVLDVAYDPDTKSVDSDATTAIMDLQSELDSNGIANVSFAFDREKYLGYALIIDEDESGDLTTGDIVCGDGGTGVYGYTYFNSYITQSGTINKAWSSYNHHTY